MSPRDQSEREAARQRQSFVRHELRGALAVMYPALSMLLDSRLGVLAPKQREYLEILERSAQRQERLISGAVESGWLDCAGAATEPEPVPLLEAVDEVLALWRQGGPSDLPVDVQRHPGPRAVAWADREHVRQVVANLLRNAAEYGDGAGAIRLGVRASEGSPWVSLTVEDAGRGIPADELPHVFEFGFRGVAARETGVPGIGIGLWVCRELLSLSGGSIAVCSDSGIGTSVTVTLPAAPTAA
jgi:two-component system, OmpR family, phosphate regulon sensor histidine kinase PhoR